LVISVFASVRSLEQAPAEVLSEEAADYFSELIDLECAGVLAD